MLVVVLVMIFVSVVVVVQDVDLTESSLWVDVVEWMLHYYMDSGMVVHMH